MKKRHSSQEIEELAEKTRLELMVHDQYPIPMRTVQQRIHDIRTGPRIRVRIVPDSHMGMDQALTIANGVEREILLSQSTTDDIGIASRANFTLAHEIGHALLHSSERAMSRSRSGKDYRANAGIRGTSLIEAEANRFARAFLMPRNAILPNMTAQQLANKFGVSLKTAEIRLLDLST